MADRELPFAEPLILVIGQDQEAFRSVAELLRWCERERSTWHQHLSKRQIQHFGGYAKRQVRLLDTLINECKTALTEDDPDGRRAKKVADHAASAAKPGNWLLTARSPIGQQLLKMEPDVACAALACIAPPPNDDPPDLPLRASIALAKALRELTAADEGVAATRAAALDTLFKDAAARFEGQEAQRVRGDAAYTELKAKLGALVETAAAEFKAAQQAHERKLAAIEARFTKEMSLRKPVSYWQWKRALHHVAAGTWLCTFLAAMGAGLYGLFTWGAPVIEHLVEIARQGGPFNPTGIVLVTIPALAWFWFLRITVRFMHLNAAQAGDAGERVAMTRTFLALAEEKHVNDDERKIVLTSLFRPMAVTQGDDTSPAAVLESLLKR